MQDLAYFFGVAAHGLSDENSERELLRFYHLELAKLLAARQGGPGGPGATLAMDCHVMELHVMLAMVGIPGQIPGQIPVDSNGYRAK